MNNKQQFQLPLSWKTIQKSFAPLAILCLIVCFSACIQKKCDGWACLGTHVAQNDTTVNINGQSYSLKKGDKLVVSKEGVNLEKAAAATTTMGNSKVEENKATTKATASTFNTNCDFEPTLPDGKGRTLKAIVELGATGFNYFVVNVNKNKQWQKVANKFGWSGVFEHMAAEESMTLQLKEYINEIIKSHKVSGKNVHFIVSSGANKDPNVRKIIKALKGMGYVVNVVTPEQEAEYAYLSAVPNNANKNKCFAIDIGSANTKIAWQNAEGKIVGTEVNKGSKYYKLKIADDEVYKETVSKLSEVPKDKAATCFIIGGAAYMLAKEHRNDKERFTCLKSPNAYEVGEDDAKKKAGLNIYKGIADATKCEHFVFDWDANFAIGYLISL